MKQLAVDGEFNAITSEVSLVSLLQSDPMLKMLRRSMAADDRAMTGRIEKMAACLMQATMRHGAYSAGSRSPVSVQQVKTPKRLGKLAYSD